MKINETTRQLMKSDIKTICDYHFKNIMIEELSIGNMFLLWHAVYMNKQYDDNNLNVLKVNGKRILERDTNYNYYPCDSNDTTLQTALISIFAELGIKVLSE